MTETIPAADSLSDNLPHLEGYAFPVVVHDNNRPEDEGKPFNHFRIAIEGPDGPEGEVTGYTVTASTGRVTAQLDELNVPETFRRKGRGAELVRAFANTAAQMGAQSLTSNITSSTALRNRIRLFGDHLTFTDTEDQGLTQEQVLQGLEQREQQRAEMRARGEEPSWDFRNGVHTSVSLTDPDVLDRLSRPATANQ